MMEELDWEIEKRVLLVDGTNLWIRCYFGLKAGLYTSGGVSVHSVFGFLRSLYATYKKYQIDYIVCAFDKHKSAHRLALFPEYKAQRLLENKEQVPGQEEDMRAQKKLIFKLLETLEIPLIFVDNHEADDVIGTLAYNYSKKDIHSYILSGDLDFTQLIGEKIFMIKPGRKEEKVYSTKVFKQEFGFDPIHMIDLKCLTGDSSDNIPGVGGIGEKRGGSLIQQYQTIENLYNNLDQVAESLRVKLADKKQLVERNKQLVKILTNLPIPFEQIQLKPIEFRSEQALELYRELEFDTFLNGQ